MKQHRFDPLSFISGLLITIIGLVYLIPANPADIIDLMRGLGAWFWPIVLVAIGLAIIVPLVFSARDEEESEKALS